MVVLIVHASFTFPAVNPAAVPVRLVATPDAGVPRIGVTKVGLVDKTTLPEPVLVVTPVPPLATGSVPVTPVVKGSPVRFVATPLVGVPNIGVTNVGLVDNTVLPLPVLVVTPVPPFATGNVPVTPVVSGKPVVFVSTPADGVPRLGVTRVGLVKLAFSPRAVCTAVKPVSIASNSARSVEDEIVELVDGAPVES